LHEERERNSWLRPLLCSGNYANRYPMGVWVGIKQAGMVPQGHVTECKYCEVSAQSTQSVESVTRLASSV
jgi:hypothetical protein